MKKCWRRDWYSTTSTVHKVLPKDLAISRYRKRSWHHKFHCSIFLCKIYKLRLSWFLSDFPVKQSSQYMPWALPFEISVIWHQVCRSQVEPRLAGVVHVLLACIGCAYTLGQCGCGIRWRLNYWPWFWSCSLHNNSYRICSNKRPFDYKPRGPCDQVKRSLGRTIF